MLTNALKGILTLKTNEIFIRPIPCPSALAAGTDLKFFSQGNKAINYVTSASSATLATCEPIRRDGWLSDVLSMPKGLSKPQFIN
ncbi:MAG: hypothetical protein ACNA7V_13380 [Bacteroidales bacterium]